MADDNLFVGLDLHKKTISVATLLEWPGESCRYHGAAPNTPDALHRLCQKLQADDTSLYFCYEAGPRGYGVQRLLTRWGYARYAVFQMAEAALPRSVFQAILNLINGLRGPSTSTASA